MACSAALRRPLSGSARSSGSANWSSTKPLTPMPISRNFCPGCSFKTCRIMERPLSNITSANCVGSGSETLRVSEDSLSAFIFNTTVLPATPLLLQRLAVFSASHQRCFSNALASLKSSLKVVSLEIDLAAVLGTILRLSWPRASRASRKPIES